MTAPAGHTPKFDDPAGAWEAYCAETPRERRSPQGALAFGFHAAPSCNADLLNALELARGYVKPQLPTRHHHATIQDKAYADLRVIDAAIASAKDGA